MHAGTDVNVGALCLTNVGKGGLDGVICTKLGAIIS
jgi:hypothetical protein